MAFDIYYSDTIVDACLKQSNNTTPPIGEYLKKLNIYQNRKKTYDNTIDENFLFDKTENVMIPSDEVVFQMMIIKL